MNNYLVQNRYTTKTKLGNWYEETQLDDFHFKEYLYKKDNHQNLTLQTASKLTFSNQPVELSTRGDGSIKQAQLIQLGSINTRAVLAYNLNEAILGEQTYAVTTSTNDRPALRNTFVIQKLEGGDDSVKYGEKIRIVSQAGEGKLYLQSLPMSPMRSSKFSRNQEVSVTTNLSSSTIWLIEHVEPKKRFDSVGQAICTDDTVLIKHCMTSQWLASDFVDYINEFGKELQVFAKSYLTTSKTQNLSAEKAGHKSVENPLRSQGIENQWKILQDR